MSQEQCDKCGQNLPKKQTDSHKEEKKPTESKKVPAQDDEPEILLPGSLKKEVRNKFKFHGLLTTYDTLVKDVALTRGSKILSRHYTYKKEFLEDVTTMCTLGLVKSKLMGVMTHMDHDNIEFFIENNDTLKDEEKSLLTMFNMSMNRWLKTHMDGNKIAFVTTNDLLQSLMQREETTTESEETNFKYTDQAEEMKRTLLDHTTDWHIFSITLSPPLDAVGSTTLSNAVDTLKNLAVSIIGEKAKVTKISAKASN